MHIQLSLLKRDTSRDKGGWVKNITYIMVESYITVCKKKGLYTRFILRKPPMKKNPGPQHKTMVTFGQEEKEAKEKLSVTWRYLIKKGIEHVNHCGFTVEKLQRSELKQRLYDLEHAKNLMTVRFLKEKYPAVYDEFLLFIPSKDDIIRNFKNQRVKVTIRGGTTYKGTVTTEDDEYLTVREEHRLATFRRDEITSIEVLGQPEADNHDTDQA